MTAFKHRNTGKELKWWTLKGRILHHYFILVESGNRGTRWLSITCAGSTALQYDLFWIVLCGFINRIDLTAIFNVLKLIDIFSHLHNSEDLFHFTNSFLNADRKGSRLRKIIFTVFYRQRILCLLCIHTNIHFLSFK